MSFYFYWIKYHVTWCNIVSLYPPKLFAFLTIFSVIENCRTNIWNLIGYTYFLHIRFVLYQMGTAGFLLFTHILLMFITDSGLYFIFGFLCVAGLTVQVRNLSGHAIFHLDLFESGASASQAEWAWHPPLYICNYGEVLELIFFSWCFFPFNLIYHIWCISVAHLIAFM